MRAVRLARLVVPMVVCAVSYASAASVGGIVSTTLDAWAYAGGTGAPTVVTWENFNGANGTNLSGQALDGPGTWTVSGGTWTIQSNQGASTSAALSRLVVDAGTDTAAVLANLALGASARAGLAALQNAAGNQYVFAVYSRTAGGTIQLYKRAGGQSLLASVTGVGVPASASMKLDATTNTLRVSFAGTQVLTYALTAGEISQFKTGANTSFGLIADSDAVTRFDDFHVDS